MAKGAALAFACVCGLTLGCGDASPWTAAPLVADENGVLVAGGERSSGAVDRAAGCSPLETRELTPEEARALGNASIDADLALGEREFEAPFHYGYCGDQCQAGDTLSTDTTIRVRATLLEVYHQVWQPSPDAPDTPCGDETAYRAVVDLTTDDGGITGRFYAVLASDSPPAQPARLRFRGILPDLRNFRGSFEVPLDLRRPHWAALTMSAVLGETGFSGQLEALVNYTDVNQDTDGSEVFRTTAGGFWPAQVELYDSPLRAAPDDGIVAGTQHVRLSDYAGSRIRPTCSVQLDAFTSALPERVVATAYINGAPLNLGYPFSVPYPLGRLGAGTLIELEVQRPLDLPNSGSLTVAGISAYPASTFDTCDSVGCVAHVQHRLTAFCLD